MYERGIYEHPKRGKQLLRFDGMQLTQDEFSTITPTDIDALIDVRDRVLILFEAKLSGKDVPIGQKVALERIVKDAKVAGKNAIVIVGEHDVTDPEQDVFLKDLIAREVYNTEFMKWQKMKCTMTAKELADWYIKTYFKAG